MRRPTSTFERAFYWRERLKGRNPGTFADEPMPGLYKMRREKGGRFVAVKITIVSEVCAETGELLTDERLLGYLGNGPAIDAFEILCDWWRACSKYPIRKAEYDALLSERRHFAEAAEAFRSASYRT